MSFEKGYKKNLPTKNLYDKDKEVGKVSTLPLIFVMQDNSIIYKGGKNGTLRGKENRLPLVLSRREVLFRNSAERAYPVIWNVFKGSSWFYSAVWISYLWVIDVATDIAYVFFHRI